MAPIEAALRRAMDQGRIAGLVATAADASGVFHRSAHGVRKLGEPAAMTMDTVFSIASMTKAVAATAAMQQVEQGRLSLDQPAQEILPVLKEAQVLTGFDANGASQYRAPEGTVTLRNLLTHTSGYVYETWNGNLNRLSETTGLLPARSGRNEALRAPLGFDPGQRWEYGIGIDIAGRMVDAATGLDLETYLQRHILGPLGMADTSYLPRPEWSGRLATVHARQPDGSLLPLPPPPAPAYPDFYPGGGGLFSTAPDYLRFLRALMNGGELDGARILRPETVALMGQNHIGALDVQPMKTFVPQRSNDVELFPGMPKKWGLSFLVNTRQGPHGRSAGSLAWAGIANTYYWLDPVKKIAGVLMTQTLPFADPGVLAALDAFEAAVYAERG